MSARSGKWSSVDVDRMPSKHAERNGRARTSPTATGRDPARRRLPGHGGRDVEPDPLDAGEGGQQCPRRGPLLEQVRLQPATAPIGPLRDQPQVLPACVATPSVGKRIRFLGDAVPVAQGRNCTISRRIGRERTEAS